MTQLQVASHKHLLGTQGMSAEEITSILDRAAYWEQAPTKLSNHLNGKFVANMFLKTVQEPDSPSRLPRNDLVRKC